MSRSRHSAPMIIDGQGTMRKLVREGGKERELFIQNLVHDHPGLIPMVDIEPAYMGLVSICREMPTPAGYVDNLWLTAWGGIVIGEAKLVRNPQARREVIAQALDYARAISKWSYEDLQSAVRKALSRPDASLWELVEPESDLTEEQFVDSVERRLRTGQLLLLIIGDGIQEGVELLTSHLQLHAGLHVGLALLELSLWQDESTGLMLVVPRVPMQTTLIERGIVRIDETGVRVEAPANFVARPAALPKASSPSAEEFFEHVRTKNPGLEAPLKKFLEVVSSAGITPEIGKTVKLLFKPTSEIVGTAGYIETSGKVWLSSAYSSARRLGKPEAADHYLGSVAKIVGGIVRQNASWPEISYDQSGRGINAVELIAAGSAWPDAIAAFIEELSKADTQD